MMPCRESKRNTKPAWKGSMRAYLKESNYKRTKPSWTDLHTALHHRGRTRRSEWRTWGFTDGENAQTTTITRHSNQLQWHFWSLTWTRLREEEEWEKTKSRLFLLKASLESEKPSLCRIHSGLGWGKFQSGCRFHVCAHISRAELD